MGLTATHARAKCANKLARAILSSKPVGDHTWRIIESYNEFALCAQQTSSMSRFSAYAARSH